MNEDELALFLTSWLIEFGDNAIPAVNRSIDMNPWAASKTHRLLLSLSIFVTDVADHGYLESANGYYGGRITQKGKDFLNEYSQRH